MKRVIYAIALPLLVAGGLVFANREIKNKPADKPQPAPASASEMASERKKWESGTEGKKYKHWEASADGKKVLTASAKISGHIRDFSQMEAVVTNLLLPEGARLGVGMMVEIEGEAYILSFGQANAEDELKQVLQLKVNDKILVKSRFLSHAPKYAFPILRGDYVEKDGETIYRRLPSKGGC